MTLKLKAALTGLEAIQRVLSSITTTATGIGLVAAGMATTGRWEWQDIWVLLVALGGAVLADFIWAVKRVGADAKAAAQAKAAELRTRIDPD